MTESVLILHSNTLFFKGIFEPRVTQGPAYKKVGISIQSLKLACSKNSKCTEKKPLRSLQNELLENPFLMVRDIMTNLLIVMKSALNL